MTAGSSQETPMVEPNETAENEGSAVTQRPVNMCGIIQEAIEEWATIHSCSKPAPEPTLARYIAAKLAECEWCGGTGFIGSESNPGRRYCPACNQRGARTDA